MARLDACAQPYAGLWLSTTPSHTAVILNDIDFRLSVCLRLGINPFFYDPAGPIIRCDSHDKGKGPCRNADLRDDPFHCLHCLFQNKKGRNTMHNRVVAHLVELCKSCGSTHAQASPKGFYGVDKDGRQVDNAQPDGLAYLPDGTHLFDVRGVDTTSDANIKINKHHPNKSYDYADINKVRKYHVTATRTLCKFSPFVFNVHGGLSNSAVQFIQKITGQQRFLPAGVSKSHFDYAQLSQMVVAIMRSNADIILAAHKAAL